MTRRTLIIALCAALAAGCSRGISVGSATPGASYSVMVANSTGSDMDVSFNDGSDHALGSVPAGDSRRFIIAGSSTSNVTISGRSATGTRTSGPYRVQLASGTTPTVTFR